MLLKTVDDLCRIVNELSELVYKQAIIIEQSEVENKIKEEMRENYELIQKKIDEVYKNEQGGSI